MEFRCVLHLDMDYFFAQVEELKNPDLKGKPVVVGADPRGGVGRGVVATSNYEARKFGIRSGMAISQAYRLCHEAVFVSPNFKNYVSASQSIMKILRSSAGKFQSGGIDEAYLDISEEVEDFEEAKLYAQRIKDKIWQQERLTGSIGVGPNKLIAKIASDFQKPNGLTVVVPEKVLDFLAPLPARRIPGIGPKTEAKLREIGIVVVNDLRKPSLDDLTRKFGVYGNWLWASSRGIDDRAVDEYREVKSIGRERTFSKDVGDVFLIQEELEDLCEEVCAYARKARAWFRTITIKIRFEDFETHTRAFSLKTATTDLSALNSTAWRLLHEALGNKKVRLIGVRVSGFKEVVGQKMLAEY